MVLAVHCSFTGLIIKFQIFVLHSTQSGSTFIPDFSPDYFASDKQILKQREFIRLHHQMVDHSLEID